MRKMWANGLANEGRSPYSCHRMAAKGMQFPWRWNDGMISVNLDVIRGMSDELIFGDRPPSGNASSHE